VYNILVCDCSTVYCIHLPVNTYQPFFSKTSLCYITEPLFCVFVIEFDSFAGRLCHSGW